MLQKKSKGVKRFSLRRAAAFCFSAAAAVSLGVSPFSFIGAGKSEDSVSAVSSERMEAAEWRKAGVNEYEITEVKKGSSGSSVKKLDDTKLVVTVNTELKADADPDSDVLAMIGSGEFVTAKAKVGGWYEVEYCGQDGFIRKKDLTGYEGEGVVWKSKKKGSKTASVTEEKKQEETVPESKSVISYTSEEFEMFCCVLEHEVGYCSEASKIAVANVIINRVKSPEFPDTIYEVLNAPKQFTAIQCYYDGSVTPSENTRECAERALTGEDNSHGAVYYYAPQFCYNANTINWFESMELCYEVDGQRYFK